MSDRKPTQPGEPMAPLWASAADAARSKGETEAGRCAAAAEKRGWDRDGAASFMLDFLKRQGPTSGEMLVNQAKAAGFVPHDDRAYGAVFQSLVRKGLIRCTGYGVRLKGHGTGGSRTWEIAA